ncbi:MAG: uncharacterized protein A8A55_1670, partial [Amphiamblys sp. WSBS2006]
MECSRKELLDCFSCKGCVTAEDVFSAEEQTVENAVEMAASEKGFVVVSVSPGAFSVFSDTLGYSEHSVARKLAEVFGGTENIRVCSTKDASLFSIRETAREFLEQTRRPFITSFCSGTVCYVERKQPALVPSLS